jgi:non-ribosomal peptide synthase protein (TIGR01720 family)
VFNHGRAASLRPGLDLSRTIGWFTTVTPLRVDLTGAHTPRARLAATVAAARSRPVAGTGFGALRCFGEPARRDILASIPPADVSFDYLGTAAGLYPGELLTEEILAPLGPYVHESWQRPHLIEIQVRITDGCLVVEWTYSRALHHPSTVRRAAERHIRRLRQAIDT